MTDPAVQARDGYMMICRPFITTKSGKRIYAWEKGLKAFCFEVPLNQQPKAANDEPLQGSLFPDQV